MFVSFKLTEKEAAIVTFNALFRVIEGDGDENNLEEVLSRYERKPGDLAPLFLDTFRRSGTAESLQASAFKEQNADCWARIYQVGRVVNALLEGETTDQAIGTWHAVTRRHGGAVGVLPSVLYHRDESLKLVFRNPDDGDPWQPDDLTTLIAVSSERSGVTDPGEAIWWAALSEQDEHWKSLDDWYQGLLEDEDWGWNEEGVDTAIAYDSLCRYLSRESPVQGCRFTRDEIGVWWAEDTGLDRPPEKDDGTPKEAPGQTKLNLEES